MNSFKELEKQQVALFHEAKTDRMFDRLSGTMETLRFFGSIMEMYMPVMADTVVCLTGGEPSLDEYQHPPISAFIEDAGYDEDFPDPPPPIEPQGPLGDNTPPVR